MTEGEPTITSDELKNLAAWHQGVRDQFPIVTGHPELAYLDSAATAQKPRAVLDAVHTYLTTANANAGRGTYPWANRTTALVERTRRRVKEFLGDPDLDPDPAPAPAPGRSAVHFVGGTTEGLRTVARDWLTTHLTDGDEILVPYADHQANLLPWLEAQRLLAERGVGVRVRGLPYQAESGDYDHRALAGAVGPRTRFVAATHVHHVYGGDMNVHRIRAAVGPEVPICLDAAQSVGHLPVSVAELDVDFVVFSGHKALALPGTGAVWARNDPARGPEFRPGGWQGTPNTAGIASLEAALDWLDTAGTDRIARWGTALAARLTDGLRHLAPYEILGCQASLAAGSPVQRRHGIVTFRHRDIPSDDLGFILFGHGFMVRADSLCQAGADETDPKRGSVRVSVHAYTTVEEIDRLLSVLTSLA
ncbi:aminotransferase class V-fold PLP-dependent enzyme [Streptomyces spongiae]|uniref:Aminotransferase class V-fold PLP-dependent enzyme n=1 Tax=Streptomyces spongiae TaxID=565072 RepID=A0A5N8XGY4_9ACTN|nr:aminotransferase class V-fold PLP-dependent enzyme [Streptomyces spongiae]MPY57815.1 aminotransferase class V-fold PLP-dependent enzyme [Streptomyces spongiae]